MKKVLLIFAGTLAISLAWLGFVEADTAEICKAVRWTCHECFGGNEAEAVNCFWCGAAKKEE